MRININADMGEGFGVYDIGNDRALQRSSSRPMWRAAFMPGIPPSCGVWLKWRRNAAYPSVHPGSSIYGGLAAVASK